MNQHESFSFLFIDSLSSNLVLNPSKELALHVMKILGDYDLQTILVVSIAGSLGAALSNYIFGIILYNLYRSSSDQDIKQRYGKLKTFFNKYGILLLLISAIPHLGKFAILAAGFTRYGILRAAIFTTIGKTLYYSYILFL